MNNISVLMTIYNEVDFVDCAIKSCLPYVDSLVIVEGAYQEMIGIGASPRSDDGTREVVSELIGDGVIDSSKIHYIEANENTDKDQRNVGLDRVKEINPDGWLLIIDGDEVYTPENFKMVSILINKMEKMSYLASYFKSLTFVNDFNHCTEQEFPRLFKVSKDCRFVNDNFMEWPDLNANWLSPYVIKTPYIKYHHYSFCKSDKARFKLKKDWWETRFGEGFDYGWRIEDGKITDDNHAILEYRGKHPTEIREKFFR